MFEIENKEGWNRAIVSRRTDIKPFSVTVDFLQQRFGVSFSQKQHDLENFKWFFSFNQQPLVIHFNVMDGVSIYPAAKGRAGKTENETVKALATLLSEALKQ